MKARRMISEGGFGPDDVVYLTNVLEEVWSETRSRGIQNGMDAAATRERLALIIIGMASLARTEDEAQFKARVMQRFDNGA
jgi:hypothetical protein